MSGAADQWDELEQTIRDSLKQLPDADQFTANDTGRIIARVRRINNDVIDAAAEATGGEAIPGMERVLGPVYSYPIGEIVRLYVDMIRLEKRVE